MSIRIRHFTLAALLVCTGALIAAKLPPGLALQPKSHIGGKPAALITLTGNINVDTIGELYRVEADGEIDFEWTLPAGTQLVVTDMIVSVNGTPVNGQTFGGLKGPGGGVHPLLSFNGTQQGSVSVSLTGGAPWSVLPDYSNQGANAVFVTVYGYLVKAK